MNHKTTTALRCGVSVLIIWLAAGCDKSHTSGIRQWKENNDGISYNFTCIDGMMFVVTPGSHSELSLAGPIGKCEG
jgi:hypothetical protein